ncbi:hypothetical protein HYV11_00525 [Candidatus Dependentiae bacterium]|nr:hypothetical protein [Candidatus Dependentiae bacterium]
MFLIFWGGKFHEKKRDFLLLFMVNRDMQSDDEFVGSVIIFTKKVG